MSNKTYPAFYKSVNGDLYFYPSANTYYSFERKEWGSSKSGDSHASDTNITRKYLEGKCLKIESPEHSELVQKLAFNAGPVWGGCSENVRSVLKGGFINFREHGCITFGNKAKGNEQITIPLPPKAEPKEWPQIGDKVCYGNGVNCEVTGIHNEVAMILTERGDYHIAYLSELKKPKTEAEILRGCVWDTVSEYIEKESIIDAVTTDLINNYNITKKPQ